MTTIIDRPFLRRDFLAGGATDTQLRALISHGRVRRVFGGVYAPTDLPDDLDLRLACAALVLPTHGVLVEHSAAWLHGVDLRAPHERFVVPEPEVVSLRGNNRVRRHGIFAARRDLRSDEVMTVGGIRVTTPTRTALDLACLRGVPAALAALDAFMRVFGISTEEFNSLLPRYHRRRGVVQLRRLVPLASSLAASTGESWTRALLIEAGFPPPVLQFEFTLPNGHIGAIDMSYPDLKIAIEYFGEEFHGPDRAEHDRQRIAWLEAHGWHVIVIRKEDLRGAARELRFAELRAVMAERSEPKRVRRYPRGLPFAQ